MVAYVQNAINGTAHHRGEPEAAVVVAHMSDLPVAPWQRNTRGGGARARACVRGFMFVRVNMIGASARTVEGQL